MQIRINFFLKSFLVLTAAALFLSGFFVFQRQSAEAQSDAIAVRVFTNYDHLSPSAWYRSKGFQGNPTPIKVDGYDAVQDGRTVYVNVANVVSSGKCYRSGTNCQNDADCGGGTCDGSPHCCSLTSTLYTNIYLISYNQDAGANTISIFNKILANWKFNTNLTEPGTCFKPQTAAPSCASQGDCSSPYSCVIPSGSTAGTCQQNCLADSDCASGYYCNSSKAATTRDVNRLAALNDLKAAIESYQSRQGHYPLLSSGTFQTGKTVSTWPSWNSEFASELGAATPVDPINKLGDCGGSQYDPNTCWDAIGKTFAGTIPDSLPPQSYVFAYSTDATGQTYNACSNMETGLISQVDGACRGSATNPSAPKVDCGNLVGLQNQPFSGFISVSNSENSPMLISIPNLPAGFSLTTDTNTPNYSSNSNCQAYFSKIINAIVKKRQATGKILEQITDHYYWSAAPCFPDAFPALYNQAQCNANKVDNMAAFGFTAADFGGASFIFDENEGERTNDPCVKDDVTLDGCGSVSIPFYNCMGESASTIISKATITSTAAASGNYPITIKVTNSKGAETDKVCQINITNNDYFTYPVADQRVDIGRTINFSVFAYNSKKDYGNVSFNFSDPSVFSCQKISTTADGRAECDVVFTANNLVSYNERIYATFGSITSPEQTFKVAVYNNPPVLKPINCLKSVRVGQAYSCQLSATDPEGQLVRFLLSGDIPPGLSNGNTIVSSALISGTTTAERATPYNMTVTPSDIPYYTAGTPRTFSLQVNNYCQDGTWQSPNFEGKGGRNNDGFEDCDCGGYSSYAQCAAHKESNVPTAALSSVTWQYGCKDNCASANGGWCGDSITQDGLLKDRTAQEKVNQSTGLLIKHTTTDYSETCDFGQNINCCSGCQWTTSQPVPPVFETPENNSFDLGAGNYGPLIKLPLARKIFGGTFDAHIVLNSDENGGTAIIFATDLSNSPFPSGTPNPAATTYATALKNAIDTLSQNAIDNSANIFVGAFGFGGCAGGPICLEYKNMADQKKYINLKSGTQAKTDLESATAYTATYSDYTGAYSGAKEAIQEAAAILADIKSTHNFSNAYIIIMSDGFVDSGDSDLSNTGGYETPTYNAAIAARTTAKIYSIAFVDKDATNATKKAAQNMCYWSSDNGINCYPSSENGYSVNRKPVAGDGTQLNSVYNAIINKILADKPSKITYNIGNSGNVTVDASNIANLTGLSFQLPNVICDISGAGATPCKTKNNNDTDDQIKLISAINPALISAGNPDGTVTAKINFSNFKFNVLPLCSIDN